MIIYLDEEGPYISWVTHHRDGFVIDWLRKPTRRKPVLHRATCPDVRQCKAKQTHWTTGRHLKACSLELNQLLDWVDAESNSQVEYCGTCQPLETNLPATADEVQLTALEMDILDYVLEITVIHLDNDPSKYELTLENLGQYLRKTPRQLTAAVKSLLRHGLLEREHDRREGNRLRRDERLFATSQGLRREPAFQSMSDQEINRELGKLGKSSKN